MNDTWAFRLSLSASHLLFGLGIAWVWALSLLLGPCSLLSCVHRLLVLLSCHCTALAMISVILLLVVTSGLMDWSACSVNFLYHSFFWTFLPNIPAGPAHSVPWASSVHFIPWASLTHFILWTSRAHFILWASSAHFILPYLFHTHGFFAKSFRLPRPNYHIFNFRAYWPLCQPHEFTNSFLELPRPFFPFSLSLRILMGLLLHSLGFLDLFFFFFWPLIILWACWPLFLLFWPNGFYFIIFFLYLFHIVGLFLQLGAFVKSGHQHTENINSTWIIKQGLHSTHNQDKIQIKKKNQSAPNSQICMIIKLQ